MSSRAKRHSSGMYVGETLNLAEQTSNLRVLGDGNLARNMLIGCAIGVAAGLAWFSIAGSQTEEALALFVAGCSGLIGLATLGSGSHIRRAAAATHKGRREAATIVLHPGVDDSEREGGLQGVLEPTTSHAKRWHMHFTKTHGWQPGEGELQVEAVYLSDVAWPVLLIHPDGLLVPIGRPRPV